MWWVRGMGLDGGLRAETGKGGWSWPFRAKEGQVVLG